MPSSTSSAHDRNLPRNSSPLAAPSPSSPRRYPPRPSETAASPTSSVAPAAEITSSHAVPVERHWPLLMVVFPCAPRGSLPTYTSPPCARGRRLRPPPRGPQPTRRSTATMPCSTSSTKSELWPPEVPISKIMDYKWGEAMLRGACGNATNESRRCYMGRAAVLRWNSISTTKESGGAA
jgi:hypothetical protein